MLSNRPRILLVGLGTTTRYALESLATRFLVVGLVRPDEPDETTALAEHLAVSIYSDVSLAAIGKLIDRLTPDCVVVSSHNRVFPASLVETCRFVNVHYAPLPKYRGRATVNWAIINGESETAITIHVLSPGLDAGNILYQECVPIEPADTIGTLYDKLNDLQQIHLADAVARYLAGDSGTKQDEESATYCCTRLPQDGMIDWNASARTAHNLIRSQAPPYPGAFTYFAGQRLKILRSECPAKSPSFVGRIPGRVVAVSKSKGFVDVLAGDGPVRLLEVELEGEGPRPATAVIGSTKVTLGLRIDELLLRIQELERRVVEPIVVTGARTE